MKPFALSLIASFVAAQSLAAQVPDSASLAG
jgi:hypothetical protein